MHIYVVLKCVESNFPKGLFSFIYTIQKFNDMGDHKMTMRSDGIEDLYKSDLFVQFANRIVVNYSFYNS